MGNKEEILPIRLTKIDEYIDNTEIIKLKNEGHSSRKTVVFSARV